MEEKKLSELDDVDDSSISERLFFYIVIPNLDLVGPPLLSKKMTLRQLKEWLDSQ